jgi:hypothetical protein
LVFSEIYQTAFPFRTCNHCSSDRTRAHYQPWPRIPANAIDRDPHNLPVMMINSLRESKVTHLTVLNVRRDQDARFNTQNSSLAIISRR